MIDDEYVRNYCERRAFAVVTMEAHHYARGEYDRAERFIAQRQAEQLDEARAHGQAQERERWRAALLLRVGAEMEKANDPRRDAIAQLAAEGRANALRALAEEMG